MFTKSSILLFTLMFITILTHGQLVPTAIQNSKALKIIVPKSQQGKIVLIDSLIAAKINQTKILAAFFARL